MKSNRTPDLIFTWWSLCHSFICHSRNTLLFFWRMGVITNKQRHRRKVKPTSSGQRGTPLSKSTCPANNGGMIKARNMHYRYQHFHLSYIQNHMSYIQNHMSCPTSKTTCPTSKTTCPTSKTTCHGVRTSGIVVPWTFSACSTTQKQ